MRWSPDGQNPAFDLMFAAAVTASLLSGFHMFTHDFSPLILAMLVAAGQISPGLNSRASCLGLALRSGYLWQCFGSFPSIFYL